MSSSSRAPIIIIAGGRAIVPQDLARQAPPVTYQPPQVGRGPFAAVQRGPC
jgi:hypothetical protein